MKISEFNTLQMNRTNEAHQGTSTLGLLQTNSAKEGAEKARKSFDEYLVQAFQAMNDQQVEVSNLQQKVITDPDSVDLHDVTIAMSKARMSLNLAQTVIDRLVSGWSEITTTLAFQNLLNVVKLHIKIIVFCRSREGSDERMVQKYD